MRKGPRMASDYGDDAGEKMIEDFARFGERMGERAMYDRARRMRSAFENATAAARGAAGEGDAREKPAEWAKLDMAEFQEIEDYAGIKEIIEAKLRAHAVDSAWFVEPATGREHLLFRVVGAREVWLSFDELSRETDAACERAAAELAKREAREAAGARDERPLEARARQARAAASALEAEGATTRAPSRGPRMQEVRAR